MEKFIIQTITKAGNELLRLRHSGGFKSSQYDEQIQDLIIKEIEMQFPNPNIIAEENVSNIWDYENETWVIDPIDGTENLHNSLAEYSISLALVKNRIVIEGAVFAPAKNELFYAKLDQGASLNDSPIYVSRKSKLAESDIYISSLKTFKENNEEEAFFRIAHNVFDFRVNRSTALEMCYVARGLCEARILANARVWDFAAASLIIKEAGGKITNWDGNNDYLADNKLVASNGHIHHELVKTLTHV